MARPNSPSYIMTKPNENDEQNRLDLQHEIWLLTLNGQLHTTTFTTPPRTILDIGCGTATWALRMANTHPSAHLTATDIHPPSLTDPKPSNFSFAQFNANSADWPLPASTFDFIHGRMITSGIHDWPRFLATCHHHLAPGGHFELLDVTHPFRAENPTADNEASSALIRFGHALERVWAKQGIDYRATAAHVSRMTDLGFEQVSEDTARWPLGEWAASSREREIGRLNAGNFGNFLRTAGVALLGAECSGLVDEALLDLETNAMRNRYYLAMKIHRARKPLVSQE